MPRLSSSSSMPPEQLAIRADALTDFNVPEALNPGGLGGLARAVLAASPRVMLPRHSPLPAAAAAAALDNMVADEAKEQDAEDGKAKATDKNAAAVEVAAAAPRCAARCCP